ncbi:MAG: LamG domain-containing protein, partial [Patescibacteria group bacterium]
NGNHGYLSSTMATSSAVAPGVIGQALEFDGSDDYVDTNNYINVFDDDFSISFWMKQTGSSYMVPVSKGYDNGGWGPYVRFVSDTANSFFYLLTNNPSNSSVYAYGALVNDGGWHHLLGVRQGNSAIYYIDGVLQNSSSLVNGGNYNSNYNPLIGAGNYNGTILSHFDGSIDDVRVYNRALSTDEISRLYDLGKTTHINKTITTNPDLESGLIGHWTFDGGLNTKIEDRSGNGNHGYLSSTMATSSAVAPGVIGQALEFDGSDDYVDVTEVSDFDFNSGVGNFSITAWIYPTSDVKEGGIIGNGDSDLVSALEGWGFYRKSSTVLGFGAFGVWEFTSSQTANINTWSFVTVTKEGNNYNIYHNAVNGGSNTRGVNLETSVTYGLTIGTEYEGHPGSFPFNGIIDDVRIYNRALSTDEISRLYDLGKTTHINKTITTNPDLESGLVGHWTFDGGLNTKIEDSSGNGNHGYLCKDMATSSAVVPGKTGQALHFDGVNDFVDVSSIAGDIASGDVSMSAWVKFDEKYDSGDSCVVVFRLGDLSSSNDVNFQFGNWYEYFIAGAGAFGVGAYDSSGHCAGSSQTSWLSGRWHHLVGTVVSGGAISAYVDGVLVGTDSMSGSRGASAATNAFIGKSLGAASAFYFPGTIDDVRIYNRVLSVEEIQKLYKLGQ